MNARVPTIPFVVRAAALLIAVAAAACQREPAKAPPPEVALFATVGDGPVEVLVGIAARRDVARVRRVDRLADADVVWAAEPTEIVAAAEAIAAGAVPDVPDAPARFRDPERRFAPLCARGQVLVIRPGARLPFPVRNLRDLADPRLAGRVALPPLHDPVRTTALAALAATYGEASLGRFLDLLGRNAAQLAPSDAGAVALVARGDADVALAGTEAAAAGALSAAGLEVVVPDQDGRGAVLLPTAVALTAQAAHATAPRALVELLIGADVERTLVARVPGLMPLRPEVPVPTGVRPAGNLIALRLDWDRVAAVKGGVVARLQRWP